MHEIVFNKHGKTKRLRHKLLLLIILAFELKEASKLFMRDKNHHHFKTSGRVS